VYLDDKAVLSNAWQVVFYLKHELRKGQYNSAGTIRNFDQVKAKTSICFSKNKKELDGMPLDRQGDAN